MATARTERRDGTVIIGHRIPQPVGRQVRVAEFWFDIRHQAVSGCSGTTLARSDFSVSRIVSAILRAVIGVPE